MLAPKVAWGLDIGESTVKAVKMRRTRLGAEILAFDSIERGPVGEEGGDRDYQLRAAVTTLAERNNFGRTPIVVSIPEPAFSRFIPLPPVDRKRIPEVVRYEARQQIPFPIEEVVWDFQPVREVTTAGEETEVAIFSLRSQFVYALLANLTLCKIQPSAVLPVPLALYNFLTFDRDVAKGTIVIDLGAGSTDILICDPENFRVRNITVSGNGITRALAERLKITPDEAEKVKCDCRDATQAARLFEMIKPTLNDLIGQVQRTIGFFKSQIHNVRIDQAMLLGNSFRLPGVSEYFVSQLGCEMLPADVLERITLAGHVDSAALKEMLPSLGVAIGLALQGIGQGRVQVNLMPREVLLHQQIARKKPYALAAVGCLAVMLGTRLLSMNLELHQLEARLRGQALINSTIRELETLETNYRAACAKVDVARVALDEPVRLSAGYRITADALNALNRELNFLGDDVILTALNTRAEEVQLTAEEVGTAPGARPAGTKVPAVRFTIKGRRTGLGIEFFKQLKARLKNARTGDERDQRPLFRLLEKDEKTLIVEGGTPTERIDFELHGFYLPPN